MLIPEHEWANYSKKYHRRVKCCVDVYIDANEFVRCRHGQPPQRLRVRYGEAGAMHIHTTPFEAAIIRPTALALVESIALSHNVTVFRTRRGKSKSEARVAPPVFEKHVVIYEKKTTLGTR